MAIDIRYNGIGLELVKTHLNQREHVFSPDNSTYLWTQWTHEFDAIYSPEATSYTPGETSPKREAGNPAWVTDRAIRHKLAQPQGIYRWDIAGNRAITSPGGANTEVDMNNGPITEVASVTEIVGAKTWKIRMRITTWINECPKRPIILSHRYQSASTIDNQQLAVRTIEGEAVFSLPDLVKANLTGDDFRSELSHPVPANFQRTSVEVVQDPGGTMIHYRVVDQELPMNYGMTADSKTVDKKTIFNITSLEATESAGWSLNPANAASLVASAFIGSFKAGAAGYAAGVAINRARLDSGKNADSKLPKKLAYRSAAGGAVPGISATLLSGVPQKTFTFNVAVTGNRFAQKRDLLLAALCYVSGKNASFIDMDLLAADFNVTFDSMDKYCELSVTYTSSVLGTITGAFSRGGLGAALDVLGGALTDNTTLFRVVNVLGAARGDDAAARGLKGVEKTFYDFMRNDDQFVNGLVITNEPIDNPRLYSSKEMRGTWLERLAFQALSEECSAPERPTATPRAKDVEPGKQQNIPSNAKPVPVGPLAANPPTPRPRPAEPQPPAQIVYTDIVPGPAWI